MLNNINNFFNLFKTKRLKKSLAPNDIVPIGVRDTTNRSDYQPSGIFFKDLQDQIGTGAQGPIGPQGVPGPVGPAGLNWQGVWSAGGIYAVDDAVSYGGASWFCINPVGPSATTPNSDPTNWALLASQGATGPQGPQGIAGPNQIIINTTDILSGVARRVLFQSVGNKVTQDARYTYNPAIASLNNTGAANIANNSSFGLSVLQSVTTGQFLSGFGVGALTSNTSGNGNTGIGGYAGNSILTANNITAVGYGALQAINADSNTGVGRYAGAILTSGKWNAILGADAMSTGTNSSAKSVAVGFEASRSAASSVVAIGYQALRANLTNELVAVGESALMSNTTGTLNTAIGFNALKLNTTGLGNTAAGYKALGSNVLGNQNTAVGFGALFLNIGDNNTAIGYAALENNISGAGNIAMGYQALVGNQNGSSNIAIGNQALLSNTTGIQNIAIGEGALNISNGGSNIAIGAGAGNDNTIGASNIMIGSGTSTQDFNNSVIIGNGAQATADNQLVIGTMANPVGIETPGTTTPDFKWLVRINEKNYYIPMEYVP